MTYCVNCPILDKVLPNILKALHMNPNGLTYERWYAAATFGVPHGYRKPGPLDPVFRAAWRRGEDPTDYAARL